MELNASFPGEFHMRVESSFFNTGGPQSYVDCTHPDSTNTGRVMRPRGIFIGRNDDNASTTSAVKMCLWGENNSQADTWTGLANGVVHPLAPKKIWVGGTTARDIKIIY